MRTNLDKIKWNNCDSFLLLLIKLESYADKIGLNKKWRKKTVRFLGGFKYCLMHQDVFCPIPDSLWNAIMQTQIERVGANFIKRKSLLWRCCRWYRRIFTHLHNELRDVQSCSETHLHLYFLTTSQKQWAGIEVCRQSFYIFDLWLHC